MIKHYILPLIILLLMGCNNAQPVIELPAPATKAKGEILKPGKLYNPAKRQSAIVTSVFRDGSLQLKLERPTPTTPTVLKELATEEQTALIKEFEKHESRGIFYTLLPKGHITQELTDEGVTLQISKSQELEYNDYLYPIVVEVDGKKEYHFVHIPIEPSFTPISKNKQKPLPPSGSYTKPMKMVAYVETNDWDPRNMGNFVLEDSKQPLFDIVVLFAANMNWNSVENRRYISFNDKLQPIIKNPDVYLRPLQDRGIKVLVDILPNHQGVGYANFQSYEEAQQFAKEAKEWTNRIGIDGWDIDEEYAEYWKLPSMRQNQKSWMWFAKAMKEAMPDKLLTLYDYGHSYSAGSVDDDGKHPKDYIDYSWANYNENHPSRAGLPNERYGQDSVEANLHYFGYDAFKSAALSNINGGYGFLMVFNIRGDLVKGGGAAEALSGASEQLYGQKTIFEGRYYPGPKDLGL